MTARITPYRDGPYLVRAPFILVDQEGNEIEVRRKVIALCRCGRSPSSTRFTATSTSRFEHVRL